MINCAGSDWLPCRSCEYAVQTPGRGSQLLQNQDPMGVVEAVKGTLKRCCEEDVDTEIWIIATKGATLGSHKDRIRCFSESRVECAILQFLVQNQKRKRDSEPTIQSYPNENSALWVSVAALQITRTTASVASSVCCPSEKPSIELKIKFTRFPASREHCAAQVAAFNKPGSPHSSPS